MALGEAISESLKSLGLTRLSGASVVFKGRDLLSLLDFDVDEIRIMVEETLRSKMEYLAGRREWNLLRGRSVALIFEKPSTRTRTSFEVAAFQLGAYPVYISKKDSQLSRGEPIKDTARVLSRYVDAIVARVLKHETLVEMAKYSDKPVINALSDLFHPTQAIGDVATIKEKLGEVKEKRVVFVGDGRDNVAHSLVLASTSLGAHVKVVTAPGYEPLDVVIASAEERARKTGGSFSIEYDPCKGVRGADVIYTDVWVSMGFEDEAEKRRRDLMPYQVNEKLLKCVGNKEFIVMHCLPAKRGEEIVEEVLESPRSVVWDQAENKLHSARAILSLFVP